MNQNLASVLARRQIHPVATVKPRARRSNEQRQALPSPLFAFHVSASMNQRVSKEQGWLVFATLLQSKAFDQIYR